MTERLTLWGRKGHAESVQALAFLREHGFRPDRVLDIDAAPPTGAVLEALRIGLGPEAGRLDDRPLPAPVVLTPKGALVGFRERRWLRFFGIGQVHDA